MPKEGESSGGGRSGLRSQDKKNNMASEENEPLEPEEEHTPKQKEPSMLKMMQAMMETTLKASDQRIEQILKKFQSESALNTTLKPLKVYLFKPTSRQDKKSARHFIERIKNVK